jgi:hypothetical protein
MDRNKSFNEAVSIVRNKLSPDSARIIQYSISKSEENASVFGEVGFGVAMRNLLAENGIIWEEVVLFSVWFAILKEAVRTIV